MQPGMECKASVPERGTQVDLLLSAGFPPFPAASKLHPPVRLRVTRRAERDQIQLGIVTGVTAEFFVMHFQI